MVTARVRWAERMCRHRAWHRIRTRYRSAEHRHPHHRCRSAEHQQSFHVDAEIAADLARRIQKEDFLFYKPPEEWFAVLDGPARDYGQAFMTERFVRDAWAQDVEIVACVPAGLFLFQDLYVMKPLES